MPLTQTVALSPEDIVALLIEALQVREDLAPTKRYDGKLKNHRDRYELVLQEAPATGQAAPRPAAS